MNIQVGNWGVCRRQDKRPILRDRSEIEPRCCWPSLNLNAARRTERCGSGAPPPDFPETLAPQLCRDFTDGEIGLLNKLPGQTHTALLPEGPRTSATCVAEAAVEGA